MCNPGALGEVTLTAMATGPSISWCDRMNALFWFIFLAAYAYMGITLQTIASKTGTPDGWLAWIPVANVYLMCKIAGKPTWWVVLFFVPFVNIIMSVLVWMGIAEARQKQAWLGVLMIIPIANLIVPAHLAFSD